MIVVTGATGNIGSKLIDHLTGRGLRVRAVARGAGKLAGKPGVEPRAGDAADAAFLTEAFAGAEAVFAMIPPDVTPATAADLRRAQNRLGEALARALVDAKVPRVVQLSSVGAHLAEGAGVVQGLYDHEQRLARALAGVPVVQLRAGYFMENLVGQIPVIKNMGVIAAAVRGDAPIAMIATRDIAQAAADELTGGWTGHRVRYLLGPRDVTYNEAASIIGKAIGRPVNYVQAPPEQVRQAMLGMGLGAGFVDAILEFTRALNDGRALADARRTAESTTPTTFESFASEVFAPAFRAA